MTKQKKHTELGFKTGRALRKVTGRTLVGWAYLAKKYPFKAQEIRRHKNDQEFLLELKKSLENTV